MRGGGLKVKHQPGWNAVKLNVVGTKKRMGRPVGGKEGRGSGQINNLKCRQEVVIRKGGGILGCQKVTVQSPVVNK